MPAISKGICKTVIEVIVIESSVTKRQKKGTFNRETLLGGLEANLEAKDA